MWIDCKTQLRSLNNCPLLNFDFGPAHSYRSIIINFWLWSPKYGWAHSFDFAEHSWSYLSGNSQLEGTHSFHFPLSLLQQLLLKLLRFVWIFISKGPGCEEMKLKEEQKESFEGFRMKAEQTRDPIRHCSRELLWKNRFNGWRIFFKCLFLSAGSI